MLNDVQKLLNEYYEALEIQKRDTPLETQKFLRASVVCNSRTGVWLAYDGSLPVGCVVLRLLDEKEQELAKTPRGETAGEVKRLFVQSSHRGKRIADQMLDALEQFAFKEGLQWIYLDSKDDLYAALKFYRRRGYNDCPRYNINPQATVFLNKELNACK